MIKVLLVDDSSIILNILKRIIDSSEELDLVGTARTGVDALKLIPKVKPDIICTDLLMPKMDGLEFTKKIMATNPIPILVISAQVEDEHENNVFELLEAGAVDVFPKPKGGTIEDYNSIKNRLIRKIRIIAGVKVFTKKSSPVALGAGAKLSNRSGVSAPAVSPPTSKKQPTSKIKILALAASTGGPQAFQEIFTHIPAGFSLPILCVQHISTGFLDGFLHWLKGYCRLPIEIAQTGDKPQSGRVYFPPERHNLKLDPLGRFYCGDDTTVDSHCPSATVLFDTVSHFYGASSLGVLMTGMGHDGASGLLNLQKKGGYTIAQDQESSIVFGMPQEAIKLGAVDEVLPLGEITPRILQLVHGKF